MKKKEIIFVFLIFFFLCSLSGNVFLLKKSINYYKRINQLRLDPAENFLFPQRKPESEKSSYLIILYGDSRIAEWRPISMHKNLTFINKGCWGQTTEQIKIRLEEDVLALSPDLVIIQAGINDLKAIGLFPNQKDKIIKRASQNIKYIAETINAKNIKTIVLSIFPTGKPNIIRSFFWSEDINLALSYTNDILKRIENENIRFINLDDILGKNGFIKAEYSKDMLHLNKTGYQRLNDFLLPILTNVTFDK